MSVVKHFIEDSIKKAEIDEFLRNEFERAGYGGVSITKTPLGTHLVVYTMRPGLVIGRGGETIRELAVILEEKFQLPSPQISVAEIEIPELNAHVVASRIASALKRGVHYRRAGFWGLNQIMEAGALGAEIIISGKLRTDRARYEKFRTGYLPKSGEPPRKYMRTAELDVQTKPGILGVKVRLIPPDAKFPDQVKVEIIEEEFESEPEGEVVEEKTVTEEKATKSKLLPAEEKVQVETEEAEPTVLVTEEKAEVREKMIKPSFSSVKEVAKPEVSPVNEKEAPKKKVAAKKVTRPKKKAKTKKKEVAKPEVSLDEKKEGTTEKISKPKAQTAEKEKKITKKKKETKKKAAKSKGSATKKTNEAEK
jgi:small subunit ribosomal protein S3